MKKLLTILASATATLFAFGIANAEEIILPHAAQFEDGFTAGEAFDAAQNDTNSGASGLRYWYTADADASNIISNFAAEAYVNTDSNKVPIASRPDFVKDNDNSKFLQIETTGKLYRTVANNGGSADFLDNDNLSTYGYSLTNAPIYLDTLVKFTAADSAFGDDALADGDKIAISYVEHESEGDGDDSYTNFVIRAGLIVNGELFQTNYYAYLPDDPTFENFNKDAWHRLTVRTIPEVGKVENSGVGFVIYLDETNLTYAPGVDAGFVNLNPTAASFYNENIHALFPSTIEALGTGGKTISAASFSGNGSLDDVVFTTTTPTFIANSESVPVTFTVPAGVTSITVNGGEVDLANPTTNLAANVETFALVVTVDSSSGYTYTGISGAETNEQGQVVVQKPEMAITILTSRNNVSYINENDETVNCATLSEAFLYAKDGSTITLPYGNAPFTYMVANWEGSNFAGYETGDGEYVLDLNGNTIDGGDDSAGQPLIKVYGTLTIVDSRGGGGITYDTTQAGTGIVSLYGSDIYIGAATGDAGATFTGKLFEDSGEGIIVKGYFDDAANGDGGDFMWGWKVDTGSTYSDEPDANGYWVVTPQSGSDTPVAAPTAETDLVYDGTEKIGVVAGTGYTLEGNTATNAGNYTATATLAEGYIWSDSTTEAKSISWSIAADSNATVDVTLTSEIAEYSAQLEFPTATATIGGVAVEGTTNWVENAISEPEAGATNTYTVTFTVTTANYAGSTGTATFKVWKAAAGKTYPSYIEGDTAKDKYDAWATANNISASDFPDTGNAYQDAYLLNCAPDAAVVAAEKAAFKFTSISYDTTQSKWVTTTTTQNTSGADYNGTVTVTGYSDVGCTVGNETEAGPFFKATLD